LAGTRRILVRAGDEAAGPLGCRWLKALAVAKPGALARLRSAWGLECRDHGRAGDRGRSRGRARARSAVIKASAWSWNLARVTAGRRWGGGLGDRGGGMGGRGRPRPGRLRGAWSAAVMLPGLGNSLR